MTAEPSSRKSGPAQAHTHRLLLPVVFVVAALFLPFSAQSRPISPQAAPDGCTIQFTSVSPFGSRRPVRGIAACPLGTNHRDLRIAVYIYVPGYGYVNKPFWRRPLRRVNRQGKWSCRISTAKTDKNATRVIAFLVPAGYAPPIMRGGETLPAELYSYPWREITKN